MTVNITISDVLNDIRANVALETSSIADIDARKRIDIASKTLVLKRNVSGACTELVLSLHRFLRNDVTDQADDEIIDADLVFEIIGGARRIDGKEKALALKLHEALVELSLQRFFVAAGLPDLAKAHAAQSVLVLRGLESLLRQKAAPNITEP